MKCLILSDLHVEHAPFEPPEAGFDLVILAGDIHNGVASLDWARASFERHPIIQVAGNHEYYDQDLPACRQLLRERATALGIHWLDDDLITLAGIEFLGCTLWTDFRVYEKPGRAHAMPAALAMQSNQTLIADYHAIRLGERSFSPADSCELHRTSRDWLTAQLALPRTGPRVVVSHHLPTWRSVSSRFEASVTNAAFVSDLEPLVQQADVWIHGHTHSSHDYRIGSSRLLCNPRGYPRRSANGGFENPGFDPALIVEIA